MRTTMFVFDSPSEAMVVRNAFRSVGWLAQVVWPMRSRDSWLPNHDDGGFAYYVAVTDGCDCA